MTLRGNFDRAGKSHARKELAGKTALGASILSAEKYAQKWFSGESDRHVSR